MKVRLWGVLAGIFVLALVAATVTACGGGSKAKASIAVDVTTLAGKAGIHGSTDGTVASARFYSPIGIARDHAGNLYIADSRSNTIRKITPAGQVTTLAGKAGTRGWADGIGASARFSSPFDLVCDAAGNLCVAAGGNGTIRKITRAGVVTTLAGKAGSDGSADGTGEAARFSWPSGIARDAAGNLYVTDMEKHTIRKITPAGVVTTLAGQADSPDSIDGSGSAARFDWPHGIACDTAGNLYVADFGSDTIRKMTPAGVVTTLAGQAYSPGSADGTGSAARFDAPWGITCDSAGNLYVTDNDTIRRITPAGEVTTVAGEAGSKGSADGGGATARFNAPSGIVWAYPGNLYVADSGNHTIRKITLSH